VACRCKKSRQQGRKKTRFFVLPSRHLSDFDLTVSNMEFLAKELL